MIGYRAEFYHQGSDQIKYLGMNNGKVNKASVEGLTEMLKPQIQKLVEDDLSDFICRTYFERTKDTLIVYVWIGNQEPKAEISYSSFVDTLFWYTMKVKPSGWLFGLDYPSLFFAHTENFFLMLLNEYVVCCSNTDHQKLFQKEDYLTFAMYYPSRELPPYVVGYIDAIESSPRSVRFKRCPSTHIPCEMKTLTSRLTWYVRKQLWVSRGKFHRQDIRL